MALDGRRELPTLDSFRDTLVEFRKGDGVQCARTLRYRSKSPRQPKVLIVNRSAVGLENDYRLARIQSPRLVV